MALSLCWLLPALASADDADKHGGGGRNLTAVDAGMGKALYLRECASCHGDLGKGDGPSAKDLKDAQGNRSEPRDLTQGIYRGGGDPVDLYYRLATGLNGTPMPSYAGALEDPDLWAVVDYVLSLRAPAPAKSPAAGREVAARYSCRGCHVLDDGQGGDVGPDLRLSAQRLHPDWVRAFLKAPRQYGKIYPWRVYRMPHLALSDSEVEVLTKYLAAIGQRKEGPTVLPDPSKFPADKIAEGKLIFMLRCTECHNLGSVIEIPTVKQQGPDLVRVAQRVDYQWARSWIENPRQIDPKTPMVVPDITPEQVDAVRMFVWKTAIEARQPGKVAHDAPPKP